MNKLVIGLLIGILIGGIGGYFVSNTLNKSNSNFVGQGNFQGFQIDDTTKQEIISFFENSENVSEINSYCEQNRMNCFYYCTEINSEHEVCNDIMPADGQGFGGRR